MAAVVVVADTPWGHEQLRRVAEVQVRGALAPGTRVTIGALDGSLRGTWTADSIAVVDPHGRRVFSIGRLTVGVTLPALLRGDVLLGVISLDGARVSLEQGADGRWNLSSLTAARPASANAARTTRRIVIDSVALTNATVELTMPDTGRARPPVRRTFSGIHLALGATVVATPDSTGGGTTLRVLSAGLDNPAVRLVAAHGTVRWFDDSVRVNVPEIRLPGSVAGVQGTIGWRKSGPAVVSLDIRADTLALADLRFASALVPADGVLRADIRVRSAPGGALRYDARDVDVHTGSSHLAGKAALTVGKQTELRDFALAFDPFDLALVRTVFGDTALKPEWRGSVTGRVAGRGGFLDSLVVDTADAVFADARVPGARSHVEASGAVDIVEKPARLIGVAVRIDTLDLRTLGAAAPGADSLHGVITGRVTLDGSSTALAFSALRLQHLDADRTPSTISGSGRVAPKSGAHWLDADLSLDTIAIATLVRDHTSAPLHGLPRGQLTIRAAGDTIGIDATLEEGAATMHVAGSTLIDAVRTKLDAVGTVSSLDARAFIARNDIPATKLSGRVHISIDDAPGQVDRHVELELDSTSTVGDAKLAAAGLRFGLDDDGFHVDTADIHGVGWIVEARGKLAGDTTRSDTLVFRVAFDSLGVLRSILLDSTGAARFPDLEGRLNTDSGRVIGSFVNAALFSKVGAVNVRSGTTSVGLANGWLDLRELPRHATGTMHARAAALASGAATLDTATADVSFAGGNRARVSLLATRGDIDATARADVTWPGDSVVAQVDSFAASVHGHAWRLAGPFNVRMLKGAIDVDALVLRSDHGASISVAALLPDRDPMRAHAQVRDLGFEELGFLRLFPEDMSGVIDGTADLSGTRDAPVITARASLDSIRSDERTRPSISAQADYTGRLAKVSITGTIGGRRVLTAAGDIPVDLTLRSVDNRIVDAPMSLRFSADSLTLADFEGLAPRVRGLAGELNGSVDVGGTVRQPRGHGTMALTNGAFEVPRLGFAAHGAAANLELAGDTVIVRRLRVADTDSPNDTAAITGVVRLAGRQWSEWTANLQSVASSFRVIDDPHLATAEADWSLAVTGALGQPRVTGSVRLPYAVFTIGPTRRKRVTPTDSLAAARLGIPNVDGVLVSLGSDVRLKSRDANVQLTGDVELFGPLDKPWVSGSVQATRGTYRVDLGVLNRTFRVDSGSVILEGTPDVPPALDIYTSYVVRQPDNDVTIGAHIYGTTDRPRLDLKSDLGTASSQSEIISYLVFGKPSFAVPSSRQAVGQTLTAAAVPSLGGFLEGVLGTVLPFFNSLQVTTVAADQSQDVFANPVESVLNNNFALTGGRQVGSDTFFSVTTGWCRGTHLASANSVPFWLGTAADYRPKRALGASISIDPGPAPCSRAVTVGDAYQIGVDLSYDWRFSKRR